MPANIEIKARIRDIEGTRSRALAIATEPPRRMAQKDTFFFAGEQRLKLRELDDGTAELIYYARPDAAGPKCSTYHRTRLRDPRLTAELLAELTGVRGVVKKNRELILAGDTRIHIDEVEGLGCFLELEVMLGERHSGDVGEKRARDLMEHLGVQEKDLVEGAYIDLLEGIRGDSSV